MDSTSSSIEQVDKDENSKNFHSLDSSGSHFLPQLKTEVKIINNKINNNNNLINTKWNDTDGLLSSACDSDRNAISSGDTSGDTSGSPLNSPGRDIPALKVNHKNRSDRNTENDKKWKLRTGESLATDSHSGLLESNREAIVSLTDLNYSSSVASSDQKDIKGVGLNNNNNKNNSVDSRSESSSAEKFKPEGTQTAEFKFNNLNSNRSSDNNSDNLINLNKMYPIDKFPQIPNSSNPQPSKNTPSGDSPTTRTDKKSKSRMTTGSVDSILNLSTKMDSNNPADSFTPEIRKVDVLIVGAGPGGLALACELQRRFVSYAIVDHSKPLYPPDKIAKEIPTAALASQSVVLQNSTMDLLASLGVINQVLMHGQHLRGASVLSGGQLLANFRFNSEMGVSFYPFGLVIEQWILERILSNRLEKLGGYVMRNQVVWKIVVENFEEESVSEISSKGEGTTPTNGQKKSDSEHHCVHAYVKILEPISKRPINPQRTSPYQKGLQPTFKSSDQIDSDTSLSSMEIFAKYVVGADGVSSIVRRAFRIPYEIHSPSYDYLCVDIGIRKWGYEPLNISLSSLEHHEGNLHEEPDARAMRTSFAASTDATTLPQNCLTQTATRSQIETQPHLAQIISENHFLILTNPQVEGSVVLFPYKQPNRWRMVCRRSADTVSEKQDAPSPSPAHNKIRSENPNYSSEINLRESSADLSSYTSEPPIVKLETPTENEISSILNAMLPGTEIETIGWRIAYSCANRLCPQLSRDVGFLVGDSCRLHSPLWGEGLNESIQDALNLGWKLTAVLKHNKGSSLLRTYNSERHLYSRRMMSITQNMRDSIMSSKRVQQVLPCSALRKLWSSFLPNLINSSPDSSGQETDSNSLITESSFESIALTPTCANYMPTAANSLVTCPTNLFCGNTTWMPGSGNRIPSAVQLAWISMASDDIPQSIGMSSLLSSDKTLQTLFLFFRVQPPGTKVKTVFGCERKEAAELFDRDAVCHLAKLAIRINMSFKKSSQKNQKNELYRIKSDPNTSERRSVDDDQHSSSALRVVWVLVNLTDGGGQSVREYTQQRQNKNIKNLIPSSLVPLLKDLSSSLDAHLCVDVTSDACNLFQLNFQTADSLSAIVSKMFSKNENEKINKSLSPSRNNNIVKSSPQNNNLINLNNNKQSWNNLLPLPLMSQESISVHSSPSPTSSQQSKMSSTDSNEERIDSVTTTRQPEITSPEKQMTNNFRQDSRGDNIASAIISRERSSSGEFTLSEQQQQQNNQSLAHRLMSSRPLVTRSRSRDVYDHLKKNLSPIRPKAAALVLARPDGYISCAGYLDNTFENSVVDYVRKLYHNRK